MLWVDTPQLEDAIIDTGDIDTLRQSGDAF
jgi:hypothetical protein